MPSILDQRYRMPDGGRAPCLTVGIGIFFVLTSFSDPTLESQSWTTEFGFVAIGAAELVRTKQKTAAAALRLFGIVTLMIFISWLIS